MNGVKTKKIIITMVALSLLSSVFAVTVNAVTESSPTHTIAVDKAANAQDVYLDVKMKSKGTLYDLFDNNGLTFTYGDSTSTNKAYGVKQGTNGKTKTATKQFTLDRQPAPKTVNYGSSVAAGKYDMIYKHVSNGGFTARNVITYKRY